MRRLITLCCLAALPLAACGGGDDAGNEASGGTGADPSTPITTVAPTTTFMPTCGEMPAVADIAAAVGVPLGAGEVVETATCQYSGLNDQSQVVTVAHLTDPGDQASFNDLQFSLGAATPLNDPALPDAMVGVDGTVFLTVDGTIYKVRTEVTGGTPVEQAALSAAVLQHWLAP